jgi:hypothetical protein
MQNWLKTQQKIFLCNGINKKTLVEPVHWSRGGLRWKVILVSFLYIYNKYAFLKSLYFLSSPRILKFNQFVDYKGNQILK